MLRVGLPIAMLLCGCAGGGLAELAGGDYPFPPKKVVKGAITAKVTGSAVDTFEDAIGDILPSLLDVDEHGWSCVDVSELVESGEVSFPLKLGPFVAGVGARDLVICLDLLDLDVELIEHTDPARISLVVHHARLALASPAVVFGMIDLGVTKTDGACLLHNDLQDTAGVSYLAEVSFHAEATLSVDEDSAFTLAPDAEWIRIHDVGVEVTQDCSLAECTDANPPFSDACIECTGCKTFDFGSELVEFLNSSIEQLFDPVVTEVFDLVSKPLLDELLNGRPLSVTCGVSLGNALGWLMESARSAADLGLLVRPAPAGFAVTGKGGESGLVVRLEGGTVAAPAHPCAGELGAEPAFVSGPFPDFDQVPGVVPFDLGVAISQAFVNQAIWSLYTSGALCIRLTSSELAQATRGKLALTAGTLSYLVPGLSGLAGPDASIRIRVKPEIAAGDFPIVEVAPALRSPPRRSTEAGFDAALRVRLPRLSVGLEAYVDNDYMPILSIRAGAALDVRALPDPGRGFTLQAVGLSVSDVETTGGGSFAAGRLDAIVELGVEVLMLVLERADPFTFHVDPGALGQVFGSMPVKTELVFVRALGFDGDWLGLFFTVSPATGRDDGTQKPGGAPHAPPQATDRERAPASGCQAAGTGSSSATALCLLLLLLLCARSGRVSRVRWMWLAAGALVVSVACTGDVDMDVACSRHADCPRGYTCAEQAGRCVPEVPCVTVNDCCPGTTCFNGVCRLLDECSSAVGCAGADTSCDAGQCVASRCSLDGECAGASTRCMAGRCVRTPPCGGCGGSTVCEPATGRCLRSSAGCQAVSCEPGHARLVVNYEALRKPSCSPADLECACVRLPPLAPHTPGPWPQLLRLSGGRVVLVARDTRYGDLVRVDVTATGFFGQVAVLDGAGAGEVTADPAGPRGGISAPGPDVGSWAAAVPHAGGVAAIAHDATRGVTRFAFLSDTTWLAYDLDPGVRSGLGADLARQADGSLHAVYFATNGADGFTTLRHAYTPPGGEIPMSAGAWTRVPVESGPRSSPIPAPCGDQCSPMEACTLVAGEPTCRSPDLLGRCDPPCDRSSVCSGGECLRLVRRALGHLPGRDEPFDEAAIAARASDVVIAFHVHEHGTLSVTLGDGSGGYETTVLDGGIGDDIGHHVAVATAPSGAITVACQDASRERLRLFSGKGPTSLAPYDVEPGGRGIAATYRSDGTLFVAHGTAAGDRVRVLFGAPGALDSAELFDAGSGAGGGVGRFVSLLAGETETLVATVRDTLSPAFEPIPVLELAVIAPP